MTILVTGACGTLGRAVSHSLTAYDEPVVLGTRTPKLLSPAIARHAQTRYLDYNNRGSFTAALTGVTTVFVIAPLADAHSPERIAPFIETAAAEGVEHLVINSAFEAEHDEDFTLRHIERTAESSGCRWTHIRSEWYMSSLTTGIFAEHLHAGEIALPTGSAGTAWVDTRDVADSVAAIAAKPAAHAGAAYLLTGPEALSWHTVTEIFTKQLKHPVRYRPVAEEEYRRMCLSSGIPADSTEFLVKLFAAVRSGFAEPVSQTVEQLTGHSPRTLQKFLSETTTGAT